MKKAVLKRDEVEYLELDTGQKGVGLGCEDWFLWVKKNGKWQFSLWNLMPYEALTSWITLDSLEQLRFSSRAKPLRDQLKSRWSNVSEILERIQIEILYRKDEWAAKRKPVLKKKLDSEENLITKFLAGKDIHELRPAIDYRQDIGLVYSASVFLEGSKQAVFCGLNNQFRQVIEPLEKQEDEQDNDNSKLASFVVVNEDYDRAVLLAYSEAKRLSYMPKGDLGEVFARLLLGIQQYLYTRDTRYQTLITCWIIGTYLFPMFYKYPYLEFRGARRTGKSTALALISQSAFNVPKKGKLVTPSEASLFRLVEACRPTQVIDEADYMKYKQYASMRAIIEAGFERGAVVPRVDKENPQTLVFCHAYTPRVFSCRGELFLEDKSIPIIMEEPDDIKYSKRRSKLDEDPRFAEIIKRMIPACLHSAPKIKEVYDDLEPSSSLYGREFQLWRPLLAICKIAEPEEYSNLMKLAEEIVQFKEEEGESGQIETVLLRCLMQEDGGFLNITLKGLTEKVQESLPWIQTWHPVKNALTNLQITKARWSTSEGVKYKLDLERVRQRAGKRGVTALPCEPEVAEETSEIMFNVKTWCRNHRNERSEIILEDLVKFVKEEIQQDPQRVIEKAFETGILMKSPELGRAVVV